MTQAETIAADGSAPGPAAEPEGQPQQAVAPDPTEEQGAQSAEPQADTDAQTEVEPAAEADGNGNFDGFGLRPDVREAIAIMGYERPTEVQTEVIIPVLEGSDIVVQAKTGSGKTAAFGIPMVERFDAGGASPGKPPGSSPTRSPPS